MWVVYILETHTGRLYTGITNDLDRRLEKHKQGAGAKFTRAHGVKAVVYQKSAQSRSEALKREFQIKKLNRMEKLLLVEKLNEMS